MIPGDASLYSPNLHSYFYFIFLGGRGRVREHQSNPCDPLNGKVPVFNAPEWKSPEQNTKLYMLKK